MKVLGTSGFLPKRPPAHGSATVYSKPEKFYKLDISNETFEGPNNELPSYMNSDYMAREEYNKKIRKQREDYAAGRASTQLTIEDSPYMKPLIDSYGRLLKKIETKMPQFTNENRAELFKVLSEGITDNRLASQEEIMERLDISASEANQLLDEYQTLKIPFTHEELSEYELDDDTNKLQSLFKELEIVHPLFPITPLPNFESDNYNIDPLKPHFGKFKGDVYNQMRGIPKEGSRELADQILEKQQYLSRGRKVTKQDIEESQSTTKFVDKQLQDDYSVTEDESFSDESDQKQFRAQTY